MIYYTSRSFFAPFCVFFLFRLSTPLTSSFVPVPLLICSLSLLPVAYQNSPIFRCIFMCVPVIPLRLWHPPPFLGRMINKAVTLFICISQLLKSPPVPHVLTFYLFPFCLASLSHIISVSSLHRCALKRRCNQFPMRLSGSLTDRLPNFISSSTPCPQIFHRFPLHPSTYQHPQMTQCPPALQPSSISQSESHTHTRTMDLCVCSFGYTRTVTAVKD